MFNQSLHILLLAMIATSIFVWIMALVSRLIDPTLRRDAESNRGIILVLTWSAAVALIVGDRIKNPNPGSLLGWCILLELMIQSCWCYGKNRIVQLGAGPASRVAHLRRQNMSRQEELDVSSGEIESMQSSSTFDRGLGRS